MFQRFLPSLTIVALSAVCVLADYFLKIASDQNQAFRTPAFALGASLYALSALGWVEVFRHMKFATVGAIFGVTTVLLLALVGIFRFNESLNAQESIGMVFAVAALVLLWRFA